MASGYKTQLTRQIGEHLVTSKLGRFGIIATPFSGNVPDYDILAADLYGHSLPIQVKTINGPSWQFKITSFLNIHFDENDYQTVTGKVDLSDPKLICVFVYLHDNQNDDFYILQLKDLQKYFFNNYKGGHRSKNPKSLHCAIMPKDLLQFKNNWKLILDKLKTVE